jgi:hypothetical protein
VSWGVESLYGEVRRVSLTWSLHALWATIQVIYRKTLHQFIWWCSVYETTLIWPNLTHFITCVPKRSLSFKNINNEIAQSVQWWTMGWTARVSIPGSARFLTTPQSLYRLWGSLQSHIQWVAGALSLGIKRQGREADRTPPSSAEIKNCGVIPPLTLRFHGVGTTSLLVFLRLLSKIVVERTGLKYL